MGLNHRLACRLRFVALGAVLLGTVAIGVALWSNAHAQDEVPNPVPTVGFTTSSCTITEGDSLTVTVALSQSSAQTVTVQCTVNINDAGIQDQQTGTIQFDPGQTSKSETFTIADDTCCQGTGTAEVVLSNPSNATLGSASSITVTVLDNDTCP